jgi:CRP-like cAMP-binding protein/predicted MFS family arabinose efflux permease
MLASYFGYCLARKASRVALLVLAFDLGGVRAAAAMSVAMLVPAAVVAPLGSVLGDRVSPARALSLGYAVQGLALLAAAGVVFGGGSLPLIAVCAALATSAFSLTRPVHQATLPDVAETPEDLAVGNAASVWVDGVASLVGPLLAGVVLAIAGAGEVLLILAAISLTGALLASRLVLRRIVRSPDPAPLRAVILDGFRELARDRDGARLTVLMALQYVVVGVLDVVLVAYVVEVLDRPSASVGVLAAAIGAGAAFGGVGSVLLTGRPRLARTIVLGALACGVPVMLLGLGPRLGVVEGLLFGYGIGKGVITVAGQALLQRTVREDVSARVFGVQEGLIQAATALGAALGPVLVLSLGIPGSLIATGLILPAAALVCRAALRRLDARAYVPGEVFDRLSGVPFLSVLSLRALERLARSAQQRFLPPGASAVRQGEPGDHYFVVTSGRAVVDVSGRTARTLGPGDGFGEIALLEDTARTATVTAVDDLVVIAVGRDDFLSALTAHAPSLAGARWHASQQLRSDRAKQQHDGDVDPR